jgi:hypothetical protein
VTIVVEHRTLKDELKLEVQKGDGRGSRLRVGVKRDKVDISDTVLLTLAPLLQKARPYRCPPGPICHAKPLFSREAVVLRRPVPAVALQHASQQIKRLIAFAIMGSPAPTVEADTDTSKSSSSDLE